MQPMTLIAFFTRQLNAEAAATRKMLERVPQAKFDWKPHPKSMTLKALAEHVAELPSWIGVVFTTSELDFAAGDYSPERVSTTPELLEMFNRNLESANDFFSKASDSDLLPDWVMRSGDTIHMKVPKEEVIRTSISQLIHHRAQLGVYLRLLDIPIPGSYGPSADENEM